MRNYSGLSNDAAQWLATAALRESANTEELRDLYEWLQGANDFWSGDAMSSNYGDGAKANVRAIDRAQIALRCAIHDRASPSG
jgi:hypothetical protein